MASIATLRAPAPETRIIPQLVNDVELMIAELQCALLETLTPEQFSMVQELRAATQVLTAARCAAVERQRVRPAAIA